ncbi:MAG: hypothetical protein EPN88_09565 [Bacteroidetes bacterium]|nr:MAG: hypothetical protein EPN88_09565 [Bacteroidota bacterium]
MDDNIVLSFSRPDFVYNNGFQIAICDKEFNVKNRFVNRTNEGITIGNASKIMGNMLNCLQYFNDTLSFWEYKYDTIYRIPDIGTCFPRYAFKYNKKQKFDKGTKDKEEDNLRAIERMIETNNYIFLKLYNPSNTRFFNEMIYLKKTKEIISLKSHDNVSGILNDIDGGIEVLPRKVLKDGRLYTSFSAFKLKQLLRENPYKSIKPVNSEKHRDLIGLINNSKMQDNPIIMIITLK